MGPDSLTSEQIHKIHVHLVTRQWGSRLADVKARFPLKDKVLQFGRIVMLDSGDIIRAHESLKVQEDTQDNTFIWYICSVDANTAYARRPEEMMEEYFFGRLLRTFVLDMPDAPERPQTLVLALVQQINARYDEDIGGFSYKEADVGFKTDEIIDLHTIQCVVGRVYHSTSKTWYFVDRTASVGSRQ
ncbi:hypothetical protein BJ165DRAFT_1530161 [Panaeolus papilionaceus]|nr:hypothetical protein BJ165DRAFT_1530161 [Panaeolus papilionaceus]